MKVGQQTEATSTIVSMKNVVSVETGNKMPINKKTRHEEQKFAQYQQATTNDNEKQETKWRDQINFNEKYDGYRQKFEEMLSRYPTMLDEPLSRVSVTKHRIQFSQDTSPVHSLFYRAGPRQKKTESRQSRQDGNGQCC